MASKKEIRKKAKNPQDKIFVDSMSSAINSQHVFSLVFKCVWCFLFLQASVYVIAEKL